MQRKHLTIMDAAGSPFMRDRRSRVSGIASSASSCEPNRIAARCRSVDRKSRACKLAPSWFFRPRAGAKRESGESPELSRNCER